ncbi:hypothetical protein [Oceanidesulfovibrio indonesiensis]|uniref:hypothetical protein n=1 Tax=Oceanidesulfovibrio indonesiensis TaxID=54767 RepID=UPI001430FC43|nr:hypothetical protein [Oceanidesulfovibrio indonesiensis]
MRVICTACLGRLYIAPDKMPADASRFSVVCPQCRTSLTVDPLQGKTYAEGPSAYADHAGVDHSQTSELMEIHEAVERMAIKLRAGMRRPSAGQTSMFLDTYDAEGND